MIDGYDFQDQTWAQSTKPMENFILSIDVDGSFKVTCTISVQIVMFCIALKFGDIVKF